MKAVVFTGDRKSLWRCRTQRLVPAKSYSRSKRRGCVVAIFINIGRLEKKT